MVAHNKCLDEWPKNADLSLGALKAAHILLGKTLPPTYALPVIYGAWKNIQKALACLAQDDEIQNMTTLDGDFLCQYCSLLPKDFSSLNRWQVQLENGETCDVTRKGIRRHLAVLRKLTFSLLYLKAARAVSHGGFFYRPKHVRFIAATVLILIAAAGGMLWANGRSSSHGLHASYFKDDNFKKCYRSRIDPNINRNWKKSSPMKGIPNDHFSVIWDGWVIIKEGELKRFMAGADDTMRVYIDGQPAIINDGPQRFREVKSEKMYGPGRHRIKVMYREHNGSARARLRWNTSNGYISVVPAARLRPMDGREDQSETESQ